MGLGCTKIILTVQIRFRLGLRLLNYKSDGTVWVQRKKAINTGFRFTFRFGLAFRPKLLHSLIAFCASLRVFGSKNWIDC